MNDINGTLLVIHSV